MRQLYQKRDCLRDTPLKFAIECYTENVAHKILLVDDDEFFVAICRKFLVRAGFDVIEVQGDEDATVRADRDRPDLLILDISMPKKDGLTIAKEIRALPWGKDVPIIILTAQTLNDKDLANMSNWAPTYYFIKGNERFEDLVTKIEEIFQERATTTNKVVPKLNG